MTRSLKNRKMGDTRPLKQIKTEDTRFPEHRKFQKHRTLVSNPESLHLQVVFATSSPAIPQPNVPSPFYDKKMQLASMRVRSADVSTDIAAAPASKLYLQRCRRYYSAFSRMAFLADRKLQFLVSRHLPPDNYSKSAAALSNTSGLACSQPDPAGTCARLVPR